MCHSFRLIFLVIVLLASDTAWAGNRDDKERTARMACLSGDSAKGVAILAELFVDTKEPTYIYNQGRCFEQNRRYDDAIARFQEYLRAGKNLSKGDKNDARKHIADCKRLLAEHTVPPPVQAATPLLVPAPVAPVEPAPIAPAAAMVLIPAGKFTMGCNFEKKEGCSSRESPAHEVELDAFHIDTWEVSVGDYRTCAKAGMCAETRGATDRNCTISRNDPLLPLDCVTQEQGIRFCAWMGKRLPTEAEWEKAARGMDRRRYSWGNTPQPSCENAGLWGPAPCVSATPRHRGTFSSDRSPFGVRDMSGGVSELVADNYDPDYYKISPPKNPTGPAERAFEVVVRGGRYTDPRPAVFRVHGRSAQSSNASVSGIGFRCAKSASDPTPVRALPATAPSAGKPGVNEQICSDACELLTLYAYDDLVANACKMCKKHDEMFCGLQFPLGKSPACDGYDELRNCLFARYGYVFSKPQWQQIFSKRAWYKPDPAFTEAKLPPVVKANIQKLKDLKANREGCR